MSGGRSPKRKGVRVERELVQLLCELGLPCARVPLSGAVGGAWSGDIHLEIRGRPLKIEVKARREFRTLQQWLSGADLVLLKADRQSPLAVLPITLLAELIAAGAEQQFKEFPPSGGEACRRDPANEVAIEGKSHDQ